jgi:ABC-type multidrug transport system fused ATPase/permease subunit
VVIAHRLRTAEGADRVVMMDRGRITATAPHLELARKDPGYARLVSVWERGILR